MKGQVKDMMKNNKKKIVSVVAALALITGGIGVYNMTAAGKAVSTVLLEVNPSIEMEVDRDADVVEVNALNADAEKVLSGMKLKGMDADTAATAIIGSLLKHGYIDELANSILVSVEDADTVRGERLQAEITEEINEILGATSVNAAILAQYIEEDEADALAKQYDISNGKAALIKKITEVNNTYEMKDLAKLSVNELNLILSNPKNEVKEVVSKGTANDSAYIGREEAKKAAFTHAKAEEANVRDLEVDFDYEYGKMVYEVEFTSGEYEYDYSINAENGEVLHSHREYDDYVEVKKEASSETTKKETTSTGTTKKETTTTEDIGKEKAKSIALAHVGVTESKATRLKVEREYDDGRLEYHVEFNVGNKEYDYEISGTTGKILDYDVDVEGEKKVTTSGTSNKKTTSTESTNKETASTGITATEDIGKEKAKSIALTHAGVTESQVTRLRVERDMDDGRIEYSVEFNANGQEYDYEISGSTGKILDYDVEKQDRD